VGREECQQESHIKGSYDTVKTVGIPYKNAITKTISTQNWALGETASSKFSEE